MGEELVSLIKPNNNFNRFVVNMIYFYAKEFNIQVNLLNDCEKWAKFNDEQKSTFINPFHFSPLSPLPNDVVVEALKINSAPLSKADG